MYSPNRTVLCVTFCYIFFCTGIPVVTETPTTEPLSPPAINGTTLLPTNGTTRSPTSGTIETAQPPTNETTQTPMKETSQPPTEDTTQPPAVNATQPPTEDTTQPPTVDTTQPPAENTTQPPTVITIPPSAEDTTQPPNGNTTQPPPEGPTSEEIDDGEYCEVFIERETDRLQAIARREGTNFTTDQLRDTVPEECHFLLDNDRTTQPTSSQPSSNGTTVTPHAANETSQSPTNVTSKPSMRQTTQPPTEDTTQPPTVDTTQPPAVNSTQPPTVITTPRSTENTTQLPTGNTTEPPTEGPTSEEIDDEEYCEVFIERETDRLQAIARREGTNFTTDQLRDTVPEECHFLLDNDRTTQPTSSQPSSNGTTVTPHAANETSQSPTNVTSKPSMRQTTQPPTEDTTQPPTVDTTQPPAVNSTQPPTVITTPRSTENTTQLPTGNTTEPPTEGPTSEEIDDEEYCEIFIERETDRLQTVARREGKNFTTEQLRDTVPEECHFLLDNDTTTQPTPSQQPVTGQFNSQPPTMGPSMGRKRRAQKWSAKSFWRDVSRKVGMRYQATVIPASVRFEVERGHVVTDKLDDAVFKDSV